MALPLPSEDAVVPSLIDHVRPDGLLRSRAIKVEMPDPPRVKHMEEWPLAAIPSPAKPRRNPPTIWMAVPPTPPKWMGLPRYAPRAPLTPPPLPEVMLPPLPPPYADVKLVPPPPPATTPLFKWDGSDIGSIDEHIESFDIAYGNIYLRFKDGTRAMANRFDNSVALICDELKPLFGLPKIGRHRCTINARIAIISNVRAETEHPFATSMASTVNRHNLQCCYLFRWVMGLTQNSDSALWVQRWGSGAVTVTSYREINIAYHKRTPGGATITDVAMKRWFGEWDRVNALAVQLFGDRNLSELRFEIERTVRRIDPKQVAWISCIVQRIQERCAT